LTVADLTTGPDGEDLTVDERIAEVRERYGPDHIVSRSWVPALEDAQRLFARADALTANPVGQPDPLVAYDRQRVTGHLLRSEDTIPWHQVKADLGRDV
jgi:hypothetical protein